MIHGRRPRQIVIVWAVALGAILLIHWFEVSAPAFHYLLLPFYWIILGIALFMTWRWLRGRSTKDRRSGDRRRADRREHTGENPTSSE
jgi:hypothetical protein